MRISTSTMTNMATNSMGNANEVYADILQKITSGKNFTKVSENVADATKVLKLKDQLAQFEQYQSNIQAALNEMDLAYDTLNQVTDELSAINSLIIQASDASTTPNSAKAISTEIQQRVEIIVDKMNTKYLDNYIFSGTYTENMPYTNEAGTVSYHGSSQKAGDRNLTIAENKTFTYNITGEEIFGKESDAEYFFTQMKELNEALNTEPLDYEFIRDKISVLDDTQKKVALCNGNISAYATKLDTAKSANENSIMKLTEDRVDLEEIDITKAATDLANAQTAMQASYLIGTNILGSVSLLDYI